MASPTIGNWQVAFGGLLFGDGTNFDIQTIDGLDSLPGIVTGDVKRAQDEGDWAGVDYAGGRTITFDTLVSGYTDDASFRAALDTIMAATAPDGPETAFQYVMPGMTTFRQAFARVRRRTAPWNTGMKFRQASISFEFYATKPWLYGAVQNSTVVPVATSLTGFSFPLIFNFTFGSAGTAGTVQLTNAGNFAARPVVTITGPVDNPVLTNMSTGQSIGFNITLGATDVLTVDFDARTVLLNGSANRRNTVMPGWTWWRMAPGSTTFLYSANTLSLGSTATVQWWDTWI